MAKFKVEGYDMLTLGAGMVGPYADGAEVPDWRAQRVEVTERDAKGKPPMVLVVFSEVQSGPTDRLPQIDFRAAIDHVRQTNPQAFCAEEREFFPVRREEMMAKLICEIEKKYSKERMDEASPTRGPASKVLGRARPCLPSPRTRPLPPRPRPDVRRSFH